MKKKLISYLVQLGIGSALACLIGYSRLSQVAPGTSGTVMAFSDGFTVIGLVWFCFGVIMFASSTGFFDAISYTFRRGVNLFFPNWNPYEGNYYDYIMEKKEKRKKFNGSDIFLVGLTLLGVAVILVITWYQVA